MTTTEACRAALFSMRNGAVPFRTMTRKAREILVGRGVAWEMSFAGCLELTPRGRGVDWSTFEA